MKTEKKNQKDRLDFFKNLYESSKNAYSDILNEFEVNMNQYRGSYEIDGSSENATTIRNITYEIIESQVSSEIPQPKTDAAVYSEKNSRSAHAVETLCRCLERSRRPDRMEIKNIIKDDLSRYIYAKTKRKPMILPMIIDA